MGQPEGYILRKMRFSPKSMTSLDQKRRYPRKISLLKDLRRGYLTEAVISLLHARGRARLYWAGGRRGVLAWRAWLSCQRTGTCAVIKQLM